MQTQKKSYWTQKELEYIKNNYGYKTTEELSRKTGRTIGAIRAFALRNGIAYKRGDEESMERFFKRRASRFKAHTHLCWKCYRAAAQTEHQCSWSSNFIPVEGWEIEETGGILRYGDEVMKSFMVKKCPYFLEG